MSAETAPAPSLPEEDRPRFELVETVGRLKDASVVIPRSDLNPDAGLEGWGEKQLRISTISGSGGESPSWRRLTASVDAGLERMIRRHGSIKVALRPDLEFSIKPPPRTHILIGPLLERLDPNHHDFWLQAEPLNGANLEEAAHALQQDLIIYHDLDDPTCRPGACLLIPYEGMELVRERLG